MVGLVVEAGDVREVHHVATLLGYGASAVNPYLAMESAEQLVRSARSSSITPRAGRQEPHQSARQGRAEDHVEDGHLHCRAPTPARRCSRQSACLMTLVEKYFTGHATKTRRHQHRHDRRRDRARVMPWRTRPTVRPRPQAPPRWAASTSGAAKARRTCSTLRRCSGCSTRPARAVRCLSRIHRRSSMTRRRS